MTGHPDKAISQRATLVAAIANGRSLIVNPAHCRDMVHNVAAIRTLGIAIEATTVDGVGAFVVDGVYAHTLCRQNVVIEAGNSATTARMLIALLSGVPASGTILGNELLSRRPMTEVVEPLRALGADIAYRANVGTLPVQVRGQRLSGGAVEVKVDSAQPVSAILLASTMASGPVRIERTAIARDHTERLLRWSGLDVLETPQSVTGYPGRPHAFEMRIPGDPSAAAVLAALHLASTDADEQLAIDDVCLNPRRLGFFTMLRDLGVNVQLEVDAVKNSPEDVGTITVQRAGPWRGVTVRSSQLIQSGIDELPLLAALATQASGPTVIADAAEMRDKDTDRISETVTLLRAFGAEAEATDDGFVVQPSQLTSPPHVDLPADHRIIFAAMVLAVLAGPGTVLLGVDAAATSFPGVFRSLSTFVEWDEVRI
ncbi:3-phosphoshikimate 1-carboxyvinyltransferase [Mycolicibacterium phlei]|uniref:3-phosphoshikimate 1-carboxyvinyltransferase n=1 Tax=Mycobacteroides chelonae TaxID=1774 RepID=UPI0007B425C1|nr:hypothetical protein [Mycobacteroides chelonae]ANB00871.1 hypothetical protein BB28_08230 [Mycobacteroides chelonae CCUG 47445]ORV12809.1 hypothetical protein AWB96_15645 [Mycobacteroides chelonae]VEG15790.1 3-phosphoshikimate 1-carboxyvinyltransferase [Mycolicibacterium phlei]